MKIDPSIGPRFCVNAARSYIAFNQKHRNGPALCQSGSLKAALCPGPPAADSVNIKILNAGAWSRSSEKVFVSLPTELEDLIPEVEDFYKKNHSGRKLHWHHLMSNGIVRDTHAHARTLTHTHTRTPLSLADSEKPVENLHQTNSSILF